jgi:DNA-directed DNA polymerase III PolC
MINLECHSHFSFGAGTRAPEDYVQLAKQSGQHAVALADEQGLFGMVQFYSAAIEAGIKPILGASFANCAGIVVLARTKRGHSQLASLVTQSRLAPAGRLSSLHTALRAADDCHLILSNPEAVEIIFPKGINSCDTIVDPGYISIGLAPQLNLKNARRMWKISRALGLACVPHYPVYYGMADELPTHQLFRAVHDNTDLETIRQHSRFHPQAHFRNTTDLHPDFKALPESRGRLEQIAQDCELKLSLGKLMLPGIELPPQKSQLNHLSELCFKALPRLYPAPGPWSRFGKDTGKECSAMTSLDQAKKRLIEELDVIDRLGFSGYFLVVNEIVDFARRNKMPMIGRGSAANSMVSYCLGITEVDPIRHKLFFERFLNPWRTSPPDIDIDFSWQDRDRVLNFVYERFGQQHVAMICTWVTFGPRGALREVAKVSGLGSNELNRITKHFPRGGNWEEELQKHPDRVGLDINQEPLKSLLPLAKALIGRPRHLGLHACGIVISPFPLTDLLPLQRSSNGFVVTQLDMHPIEELGLLKIDLLAQRGLGVYGDMLNHIQKLSNRGLDNPQIPQSVHDIEQDPLVRQQLAKGETMGCFYIESTGMRSLLRKLNCACFEDLVAASSIIRPGVSESGMMQTFISRHNDNRNFPSADAKSINWLHPIMKEELSDTYGVMVYQEDVIKMLGSMAGMDLGKADLLRRAMCGKAAKGYSLDGIKQQFLNGCQSNGICDSISTEVWRQIESFAGYAFCKAHSASFAILSYRISWLKVYYPAEMMAAVLSNQGGYYSTAAYIQEARRMGLAITSPDVSHGQFNYQARADKIQIGLQQIKGLKADSIKSLIEERSLAPFRGLLDLKRRVQLAENEFEALIFSGACDTLPGNRGLDPRRNRPALLLALRNYSSRSHKRLQKQNPELPLIHIVDDLPPAGCWSHLELWKYEREVLGFGVCLHPLELFDFSDMGDNCITSIQLQESISSEVRILGWKFSTKTIRTRKKHETMSFLSMEDQSGTFEAVLFPAIWEQYAILCRGNGPFLLEGKVENEAGVAILVVSKMYLAGRLSELETRRNAIC